jgi:hypothetical protein
MRYLSWSAAAVLFALAALPGHAALPDPAADCTTFTTVQAADGRTWEIRGFVCLTPGKPPKVEVTDRRETDPSRSLKQRLIW